MRAFVFPGQGAQTIGMGRALAEAYPAARAVFDEVDEALGEKLSALIWSGDIETLTLTRNAQPALMATSVAAMRVLDSHRLSQTTEPARSYAVSPTRAASPQVVVKRGVAAPEVIVPESATRPSEGRPSVVSAVVEAPRKVRGLAFLAHLVLLPVSLLVAALGPLPWLVPGLLLLGLLGSFGWLRQDVKAAEAAVNSPLLETSMEGAHGVLGLVDVPAAVRVQADAALRPHRGADRAQLPGAGADHVAGHQRGRGLAEGAGLHLVGEVGDRAVPHREVHRDGGAAELRMRGGTGVRGRQASQARDVGGQFEDATVVDVVEHGIPILWLFRRVHLRSRRVHLPFRRDGRAHSRLPIPEI